MDIEVEAKFRADGTGPLEVLRTLPALGPARLGPPRAIDELDRYLDTPDGRLAAARWACRLRRRGDAWRVSLKGPPAGGTDGGAMHHRPEVEGAARERADPATWPESPARAMLLNLTGGAPLHERLRLRQRRTERPAVVDGTASAALLTLDEVTIEAGGATIGELRVVELERAPGAAPEPFEAIVRALAAIDGLVPDPGTKLEHALALLGDR